jgi:GAF domain-containing protein
MLKGDQLIGVISIYRQEVRPFTDKQIELVQNFAAQAVIAIENARLLNELRESLDRQTATADILRVIAGTPEDSKHALDTIAQTASRMFGVANVNLRRIEGDVLRVVSSAGPTIERLRKALPDIPLEPTDPAVRCFLDNRQIPIDDRQAVLANERGVLATALRELPVRSQVFTPLSREGKAIGVMIVTRGEVQPFQQSDLDIMKGFADQAVIAIENARLLNELRESLDRQTATSDILRVIAGTPEDSKRALDTIAETASRMFDTANVNFRRLEGNVLRMVSSAGPSVSKLREVVPDAPLEPTNPAVPSVLENRQIAVDDRLSTLPNERGEISRALHDLALGGLPIRSQAFTPLLREGKAIGVMIVSRSEVRPFQAHELELMKGFADQAVIAIENARLLSELRERTAEVVKLNQQLEQRVADQVGEIERMGRLRRFLPPQVADLIVASGTEKQLESHRREIRLWASKPEPNET